jgi:hypothetical protein
LYCYNYCYYYYFYCYEYFLLSSNYSSSFNNKNVNNNNCFCQLTTPLGKRLFQFEFEFFHKRLKYASQIDVKISAYIMMFCMICITLKCIQKENLCRQKCC